MSSPAGKSVPSNPKSAKKSAKATKKETKGKGSRAGADDKPERCKAEASSGVLGVANCYGVAVNGLDVKPELGTTRVYMVRGGPPAFNSFPNGMHEP